MPTRIFLMLCASLLSAELFAATFTVDSDLDLVDDLPGDGVCLASAALPGPACTLRAAIMEAEANGEVDTVVITEGLQIELTLTGDGGPESGTLDITTEVEILGFIGAPPGNPALLPLIDATGIADRHFFILGGDVTLRGLRLVGGATTNSGGAVWAAASSLLRVESSWFANNTADIRGGAIRISSSATATIEESHFFRNDGGTAGGGALALEGG